MTRFWTALAHLVVSAVWGLDRVTQWANETHTP